MRQLTLATVSFDKHRKQTRRAAFPVEMDRVVPWRGLSAEIEPVLPEARQRPSADRPGTHAAATFPAALVQSVCGG